MPDQRNSLLVSIARTRKRCRLQSVTAFKKIQHINKKLTPRQRSACERTLFQFLDLKLPTRVIGKQVAVKHLPERHCTIVRILLTYLGAENQINMLKRDYLLRESNNSQTLDRYILPEHAAFMILMQQQRSSPRLKQQKQQLADQASHKCPLCRENFAMKDVKETKTANTISLAGQLCPITQSDIADGPQVQVPCCGNLFSRVGLIAFAERNKRKEIAAAAAENFARTSVFLQPPTFP